VWRKLTKNSRTEKYGKAFGKVSEKVEAKVSPCARETYLRMIFSSYVDGTSSTMCAYDLLKL
jgi:hypothetical protein